MIKKLSGMPQVLWKLKSSQGIVADSILRGLTAAGLFLQRESQKIVPVQTGNLKNSAFTRHAGAGIHTDVIVGYTAAYAAYVHEDPTRVHGQEFNVKHAEEIAEAGRYTKAGRWKPTTKKGTARGGMFPRGEKQQYKFLERPAREKRLQMIHIIREVASKGFTGK